MRDKTLILDVDGVMRDIVTPTIQIYNEQYMPVPEVRYGDVREYNLGAAMPKVQNWKEFFYNHGERVFRNAQPNEPDLSTITQQLKEKYILHVASVQFTNRNRIFTLEWLENNGVVFDNISFTDGSKTGIRGHIIIDDCIAHLSGVEQPICYAQPWNTAWNGEKISSLKEFMEKTNGRM